MQRNMGKVNQIDYVRWNEWGGMWTEGNEMKHEQRNLEWKKWDETWTMNVYWKRWDKTWTMKLIL